MALRAFRILRGLRVHFLLTVTRTCQICSGSLTRLVDFGRQPICNRYLSSLDQTEYRHELVLSQCRGDGLLQLARPWPSEEVRPRLPWISYQEPEPHLDDVVDRIIRLPGVSRDTLIAGLSYKDYSVLDRLEQRGFRNIWKVALSELGLDVPGAGMESIQQVLTPAIGESLRASRGAPGVIVVRHLIEHSNSVGAVLQALQSWGDPAAHFVFEVPDSEDTFRKLDVSTLWEEHVSYFTEFTLRRAFVPHGLNLLEVVRYPYALEDCLVAFVMSSAPASLSAADPDSLDAEVALGTGFRNGLEDLTRRCHRELKKVRERGETVALLGAGHRAATFLNLLSLGDMLSCVIDDDPRKTGLYMPGNQLPILSSAHLMATHPSLCLLAASPDSEPAVLKRNEAYLAAGGRMASIYPRSSRAWAPLFADAFAPV